MTKFILCLFMLLFPVITTAQNFSPINIVTGEWPPYTSEREDGYGLATKIVRAAFNDMGYEPQISFLPFYLGYDLVKKGKIKATYPYFKNDVRSKEMYYSEPLIEVENVVFYIKEKFPTAEMINNPRQLGKYKIGFVKGYSYFEEARAALKNTAEFKTELTAFKMLLNGKIDFLPATKEVGQAILRRHFNDVQHKFGYLPGVTSKQHVYLIASKRNPGNKSFIDQFNTSLERINTEGIYNQILETFDFENGGTRLVRLNGLDSFPMIRARENKEDDDAYILPRGTRAIVLEWSERFLKKGKFKMYDEMFNLTRVRIIEGPLKGKVLFVENMYIEFE